MKKSGNKGCKGHAAGGVTNSSLLALGRNRARIANQKKKGGKP